MTKRLRKTLIAGLSIIAGTIGVTLGVTYAGFTKYHALSQSITAGGTRYLYLKIGSGSNSDWTASNPVFYMYSFRDNSTSTWGDAGILTSGTAGTVNAIYRFELPTYGNIIFVRESTGTTNPSWSTGDGANKLWNQTVDLTVPTNNYALFTITGKDSTKYTGSWSAYP